MKLRITSVNLRYDSNSELNEARVRFDGEDGKDKLNFNGDIRLDKDTYKENDSTEKLEKLVIERIKNEIDQEDSDDE